MSFFYTAFSAEDEIDRFCEADRINVYENIIEALSDFKCYWIARVRPIKLYDDGHKWCQEIEVLKMERWRKQDTLILALYALNQFKRNEQWFENAIEAINTVLMADTENNRAHAGFTGRRLDCKDDPLKALVITALGVAAEKEDTGRMSFEVAGFVVMLSKYSEVIAKCHDHIENMKFSNVQTIWTINCFY